MRKQQIQYTSPLDALVAVAKRLSVYESQQNMDSEDFFDRYSKGLLSDEAIFVEWANDYRHYFGIRQELEKRLQLSEEALLKQLESTEAVVWSPQADRQAVQALSDMLPTMQPVETGFAEWNYPEEDIYQIEKL